MLCQYVWEREDPDDLPFEKKVYRLQRVSVPIFIIGREEKAYHFRQQKKLTQKHSEQEQRRVEAAKSRFATQVIAKRGVADQEDHRSVYDKIKKAATYFKGDSDELKSVEELRVTRVNPHRV